MKEMLNFLLLKKSYFYRYEGQEGNAKVQGSGSTTVPRWTPYHYVYRWTIDEVNDRVLAELPNSNFKPYFTEFTRIK